MKSELAAASSNSRQPDRRFRVPVAAALVGGVSLLILVAVGGVLLITFFSARTNTLELLRDRADLGLELLETRIRGQLDPIAEVGNGMAALIGAGDLDPTNLDQVRAAFRGALSAVPQATAIIFVGTDHHSRHGRHHNRDIVDVPFHRHNISPLQCLVRGSGACSRRNHRWSLNPAPSGGPGQPRNRAWNAVGRTMSEANTIPLVLAVDDDPNIHEFLGAIVRQRKLGYSGAGTGRKAMAMAKKRVPDLVFMDVMLPDTDGFQLCQDMRDEIEGFDAPVVFLSVKHSLTDIQMAMAMAGSDYLAKPFTPDQITARLNKWLGAAE